MRVLERCTLFFQKRDALSNWYPCRFTYKGIEFNCVEQFMMYCKAKLFKSETLAGQILIATKPEVQKQMGRHVANFDKAIWDSKCRGYVKIGCREKFLQNPKLMEILLQARGPIAEASPHDMIWGIGLSKNDPRAENPDYWIGENRLGKILTELRDEFLEEKLTDHH